MMASSMMKRLPRGVLQSIILLKAVSEHSPSNCWMKANTAELYSKLGLWDLSFDALHSMNTKALMIESSAWFWLYNHRNVPSSFDMDAYLKKYTHNRNQSLLQAAKSLEAIFQQNG